MIDKKKVTIETTSCIVKGRVRVSVTICYDDDTQLKPLTDREIYERVLISCGLALKERLPDESNS